MSAAEAPKSEQIQANVAAALSRLRGELGAASSPVASPTPIPLPKVGAEPMPVDPLPEPAALAPLPAGPVRTPEATTAVRPFEPTLNAMSAGNSNSAPGSDAVPAPAEAEKPDLFGRLRADPSLTTDRAAAAAMLSASEAKPESQPDLLTGMEVPPAPPPPLGSFEAEDEVNGRGRRMRNRLMVLAAIVVIVGGAAWAWVASHPAPDGPVPVITAETTPEKVKPEDEGGMQVPNQNVEILNGQPATAEQPAITAPPEQPVSPPMTETTDEANAAAQAPAVTDAVPTVDAPAIPSVSAPDPSQTAAAPAPVVSAPVVSEAETQQAAPAPAEPAAAPATTAEQPAEPAAPAAATTAKAPEATPEPAPAPAPKAAEPTQTAAAPTAPAAPSVAPTTGGGSRVQLAAVKSEALAKAEWAKLQKAHPGLLGGLTLNVQAVDKNGSKLYRIQAGPLTKAQAKDLCTQLKAQKQDCIVAK